MKIVITQDMLNMWDAQGDDTFTSGGRLAAAPVPGDVLPDAQVRSGGK